MIIPFRQIVTADIVIARPVVNARRWESQMRLFKVRQETMTTISPLNPHEQYIRSANIHTLFTTVMFLPEYDSFLSDIYVFFQISYNIICACYVYMLCLQR